MLFIKAQTGNIKNGLRRLRNRISSFTTIYLKTARNPTTLSFH